MKVYITYELGDHGLWDTTNTKVFSSNDFAKEYKNQMKDDYDLDIHIAEFIIKK
jgi:hypothetical protein